MYKLYKENIALLISSLALFVFSPIGFFTLLLGGDAINTGFLSSYFLLIIYLATINVVPALILTILIRYVFKKTRNIPFLKALKAIWLPTSLLYVVIGLSFVVLVTFF